MRTFRLLLLTLVFLSPEIVHASFLQLHVDSSTIEKGTNSSLIFTLEEPLKIQDADMRFVDEEGTVFLTKTLPDFHILSPTTYQTTIELPSTLPSGTYYIQMTFREEQTFHAFSEVFQIEVTGKSFFSVITNATEALGYYLSLWWHILF